MPKQKSEFRQLLEKIAKANGRSLIWANAKVMELKNLGFPGVITKEDAARETLKMSGE